MNVLHIKTGALKENFLLRMQCQLTQKRIIASFTLLLVNVPMFEQSNSFKKIFYQGTS